MGYVGPAQMCMYLRGNTILYYTLFSIRQAMWILWCREMKSEKNRYNVVLQWIKLEALFAKVKKIGDFASFFFDQDIPVLLLRIKTTYKYKYIWKEYV